MLSIKKIGGTGGLSVAGAAAYYEGELRKDLSDRMAKAREAGARDPSKATDEYLMGDTAAPLARWWSTQDALVPNGAPIHPGQLPTLLFGERLDGTPLVQAGAGSARVNGWDLTFSAPKDVSALYAAADPTTRRALLEDIAASAGAALRTLHEIGAIETRRGKGGQDREAAHDVAVALFPQATSRAGDPQLHCHAVLINGVVRTDGTTGAIASQRLYFEKTFGGGVFRAELADRMAQRGLGIEEDGQAFRIAGVDKALSTRWSSRRAAILDKAGDAAHEGDGKTRRLAKQSATLATRAAKDAAPSGEALEARWQADMKAAGLTPAQVWQQAHDATPHVRKPDLPAGDAALDDALTRRAVVRERELRRIIAEKTQARGGGAEAVKAEFNRLLSAGRVLELMPDGQERVFSTREVLDRERQMILDARERTAETGHIRQDAAERAIAARPTLSDEQIRAVRWIAAGGGVVIAEGVAGSGKTFAMSAVTEAVRDSVAHLVALAPTWKAVHALRAEIGEPSARALRGFLLDLDAGRIQFGAEPAGGGDRGVTYLGTRAVILLDEAGMVGSADMAALLRHAREGGAQVVLVGDRKQLRAVEPGEPMAALADEIGLARMQDVRRQDEPWMREASIALSRGKAGEALTTYDKRGHITWAESGEDAIRHLADAAMRVPEAQRLVLAHRNSDVHALNAALRERAVAAGQLGQDALTIRALQPGGLNGKGEVRDMEIRAGDRIAVGINLTRTGRDITNGDTATIESFIPGQNPTLRLRVDRTAETLALRLSELEPRRYGQQPDDALPRAPAIAHAYARSIHKSQGATADQVFIYGSSGLDAQLAYVSMSRHRQDVRLAVNAGAIRERLTEEGSPADMPDIKRSFMAWAERPGERANAGDYVQDRERWLATGDPSGRAPSVTANWPRTRETVRRIKIAMEALRDRAQQAVRTVRPRPVAPPLQRPEKQQEKRRGLRM